jgi:hypothetical protein
MVQHLTLLHQRLNQLSAIHAHKTLKALGKVLDVLVGIQNVLRLHRLMT